MSQTIAFLVEDARADEIDRFAEAAERFGYAIRAGLDAGDEDAAPGIARFLAFLEGSFEVIYLDSDRNSSIPLAYSVYEEVLEAGNSGKQPKFCDFLRQLKGFTCPERKFFFITCTEWSASDEVRYLEGGIESLTAYIGVTQTLGMWIWSPETGRIQDIDRYPLVFRILADGG